MTFPSPEELLEFSRRVLHAAGTPDQAAQIVGDSLVKANLLGHDSHGVMRLPSYVERIRAGGLAPAAMPTLERETGATGLINGHKAFGQLTARFGVEVVGRLAADYGIAAVVLLETTHVGRLGEYVELLSGRGFGAIAMASGAEPGGAVAPFGGYRPVFGTNPLAWSVPAGPGRPPLIGDFSTAGIPAGKVAAARSRGERVPEGVLVDSQGLPTTDPAAFRGGGSLLPFGGHKGSSLMMMIELLTGILGGNGPSSSSEFKRGNPTMLFAFKIDAFVSMDRFVRQAEELRGRVQSCAPARGFDRVRVPHEIETETEAKRRREGIPLPDPVRDEFTRLAQSLQIAPL